MQTENKSDVQLFWEAICKKTNINRPFNSLNLLEVQQLIHAINLINCLLDQSR